VPEELHIRADAKKLCTDDWKWRALLMNRSLALVQFSRTKFSGECNVIQASGATKWTSSS